MMPYPDHPRWPRTVDEAVDMLLSRMSDADKETLRHMSELDLLDLHFSLGMYVRNQFGLWQGNNQLLAACTANGHGIVHPDDASNVILRALLQRLHDQDDATRA